MRSLLPLSISLQSVQSLPTLNHAIKYIPNISAPQYSSLDLEILPKHPASFRLVSSAVGLAFVMVSGTH